MSSEKTSNLGLHKWAPTDGVLRTEFNDNFGKIDEKVAGVTSQLAEKVTHGELSATEAKIITTKESVETTPGRWWTQNVERVYSRINYENRKVFTVPMQYKKRVVFFGSSTTEGYGTTNTSKFFGKLLEEKLVSKGYEFFYRGVGGDTTAKGVTRFYRDVAPTNADFVIIAFTIGNEGIYTATDKSVAYKQFKDGILKICHMVEQQGAIPIIMTQAPTRSYNTEIYNYSKKMNEEFETSGYFCIDFGGAVDDLNGQPIAAGVFDDLHYNDAGHVEISNAIPPTIFEAITPRKGGFLTSPKGHFRLGQLVTQMPIAYTPEYPITTFTAFLRFRRYPADNMLSSFISFNAVDRIALRLDGSMDHYIGGVVEQINATSYSDGNWHSFALSYNNLSKKTRIYIDGVFIKEHAVSNITFSKLAIGGREGTTATSKNTDIKDIVLYRTRLNDSKIRQLHEGFVSQASLEIFSPLHDKLVFANGNIINFAPTTVNLKVDTAETAISSVND